MKSSHSKTANFSTILEDMMKAFIPDSQNASHTSFMQQYQSQQRVWREYAHQQSALQQQTASSLVKLNNQYGRQFSASAQKQWSAMTSGSGSESNQAADHLASSQLMQSYMHDSFGVLKDYLTASSSALSEAVGQCAQM